MEEITYPMYNEFEELVQSNFINPKEIKGIDKNKAFLNMNKEILTKEKEDKIKEREKKKKQEKQLKNSKKEKSTGYYDVYEDQLGRIYQIPKNVKFGMHVNDSFFEVYARETIFQLFNYSIMKYMNYNFELKDNKSPIKDKEKKNIQYTKINSENNNDTEKVSVNEKNDKSGLSNDNINTNIIASKVPNIKVKDNLIKFIGDFDFILPGLKTEDIKSLLINQDLSPFIFYGNIDLINNEEFDVIGEVKENYHNNLFKIEQIKKYFNMIKLFKKEENDKIQFERFGFHSSRTKILMLVFDASYSRFLKNMLDYKINRDKFTHTEKNFKNESSFIKICETFKEYEEKKKIMIMKRILLN